jgi:spermidine synthase
VSCVTVDRLSTPRGELALRRDGEHYEIVSNGVFLMDTRDGRSERELVRAALSEAGPGAHVVLGGLGVGFSLAEALRLPGVTAVTVVEIEPAVLRWHRSYLAPYSAGGLHDPRVSVVTDDIAGWLAGTASGRVDAICLDVDNGPEWTVSERNSPLYDDSGLDCAGRRLAPGGTLAVWSAAPAAAFEARLRAHYARVAVRTVPARRGQPDVIYLARDPRAALPGGPALGSPSTAPTRPSGS